MSKDGLADGDRKTTKEEETARHDVKDTKTPFGEKRTHKNGIHITLVRNDRIYTR